MQRDNGFHQHATRTEPIDSPWTPAVWRQERERKRQGSVTLIGKATHTSGNQSAQVLLETQEDQDGKSVFSGKGVLVLRLTDRQADARLEAAAKQQGISEDKLTGRMAYKRLELPVTFSPRQAEQLALAQALGLPITVTLSRKPTPKGRAQHRGFSRAAQRRKVNSLSATATASATLAESGTYLHVAFDLPAPPPVATRHQGCLGVDVNAWGLSYAAVDAQGQLLHATDPLTGEHTAIKGDIVLPLRGKSAAQAKHCLRHAAITMVALAAQHRLAIAIEALDFSRKKSRLREMPAGYARMLSRLATAGFADSLTSRCRKDGVAHHQVAPAWTSVAGFAKYGEKPELVDRPGRGLCHWSGGRAGQGQVRQTPTHTQCGRQEVITQVHPRPAGQARPTRPALSRSRAFRETASCPAPEDAGRPKWSHLATRTEGIGSSESLACGLGQATDVRDASADPGGKRLPPWGW